MKILFYIHALAGGGAERVWALLATELARAGHDVLFAVDYPAAANLRLLDGAIRAFELGVNHFTAILALGNLIRREKPDVSISALGAGNLKHVAAALLAGRLDRSIISYHGYIENEPKRLSHLSFRLTPVLSRLAARTVAVSQDLGRVVVESYGAAPRRLEVILNPVAVPPVSVTDAGLAARPPLVLAASRLAEAKNLPHLVRSFARVRHPDARLEILGDGDGRPELEAEIARLGLGGRVTLHGYHNEPWSFFDKARVFAISSRMEAFGLTVVEALGHGLPVVTTDCGGPREILDQPGLGTLVPQGDEAAFAAALDAALADPGKTAPRLARAAAFSVPARTAAYLDLFGRVAGAARSRSA